MGHWKHLTSPAGQSKVPTLASRLVSAHAKHPGMKVLIVHSGNLFGGIEAALNTLVQNMEVADGVTVDFALCFDGKTRDKLEELGTRVHKLPDVRISRPLSVLKARRSLRTLLTSERYSLTIFVSQWGKLIFGAAARHCKIPVVFWMHDFLHGRGMLQRIARHVRPDYILANSRFTAAVLPTFYPGIPWELFYNPVPPATNDLRSREAIRRELETSTDTRVIIQVSRMEEWKGHRYLIEALGKLKDATGWTCWIVGGAQRDFEIEYLDGLKKQATQLGISDRIKFLGFRTDVPSLLAAADIFCQSNKEPEPFGIVFIEAMYAGLPVVTFDMGGAKEIVTAETGMLIPPTDTSKLAAGLAGVISDPQKCLSLGERARSRAGELCDPRKQAIEFSRLLRSFVDTKK